MIKKKKEDTKPVDTSDQLDKILEKLVDGIHSELSYSMQVKRTPDYTTPFNEAKQAISNLCTEARIKGSMRTLVNTIPQLQHALDTFGWEDPRVKKQFQEYLDRASAKLKKERKP